VISCENGHVLNIHLAIVGHVGECKSGATVPQAIPEKADCLRRESMDNCNGHGACSVRQDVFNYHCHKGRRRGDGANAIVIIYDCVDDTGKIQC